MILQMLIASMMDLIALLDDEPVDESLLMSLEQRREDHEASLLDTARRLAIRMPPSFWAQILFFSLLGILIFWAQVPHVTHQSGMVYALFALTLLIVQLLPAARDLGQRLRTTNSLESPPFAIERRGSLMVIVALPVLVTVTVLGLSVPR